VRNSCLTFSVIFVIFYFCPVIMAIEHLDRVTIQVPGSTANLGPYFDRAGAAIQDWMLEVTLELIDGNAIDLLAISDIPVPRGRERGYAGVRALEQYLKSIDKGQQGCRLTIKDISREGFLSGGTGSSGAEATGAVIAAAVLFGQSVSTRDIIIASAKGEPQEHKDNVAPSVLGGIVFLSDVPSSKELFVVQVPPPRDLGLAIGFSSHQKTEGTESTRKVLEDPVEGKLLVRQVGRAVAGALSLERGNVGDFLKFVLGDEYHEPRRAEEGIYGNFSASEFAALKHELYEKYRIALAVSGAGPSMQFWFDKKRPPFGITEECKEFIGAWFTIKGINLRMEEVRITTNGAYHYARGAYPQCHLNYFP